LPTFKRLATLSKFKLLEGFEGLCKTLGGFGIFFELNSLPELYTVKLAGYSKPSKS